MKNTVWHLSDPLSTKQSRTGQLGPVFFNNAAIAALVALDRVDRVAISDWDLPHGSGTHKIVYTDDHVL